MSDPVAAAAAALAEHQHLIATRDRLARDVASEIARVAALVDELARERRDVEERVAGVLGFLYALVGDEQLTQEQREVAEAEARLAEAVASRDHLVAQLASVEARLAGRSLPALAGALNAARVAKEQTLIDARAPSGAALAELAIRIEAIDIELVPLGQAVLAGDAAVAKLDEILAVLDRARSAELAHSDARGMAGQAQGAITVFQRAVDQLAVPGDGDPFATAISDDDRLPFVDPWIRALVGKGDRTARLATAHATIAAKRTRVAAQLAPIRVRRDDLAGRRRALEHERVALIDAPTSRA